MKSIANRFFLFAAAALSLGTVAYGQTALKADVPFEFRTAGGASSAGRYTVQVKYNGNAPVVQITNSQTLHGMLSISSRLDNPAKGDIQPRLVFRCGETGCALSEIWTRDAGFKIPVQHVQGREYLASIPLVAAGD